MRYLKIVALVIALVFAIWFALTGWMSFYAIYASFPFGLAALILYFTGRWHSPGSKLNRAVLWVLIVGLVTSIVGQYLIINS